MCESVYFYFPLFYLCSNFIYCKTVYGCFLTRNQLLFCVYRPHWMKDAVCIRIMIFHVECNFYCECCCFFFLLFLLLLFALLFKVDSKWGYDKDKCDFRFNEMRNIPGLGKKTNKNKCNKKKKCEDKASACFSFLSLCSVDEFILDSNETTSTRKWFDGLN